MGLSVGRVSSGDFLTRNAGMLEHGKIQKTPSAPKNDEVNLNYSPKNLNFTGLFFNRKKEQPYGSYGPYKLNNVQIERNNRVAESTVNILGNCAINLADDNGSSDEKDLFFQNSIDKKTVSDMVPLYLALFTNYQLNTCNFPEFYDLMARAVPRECTKFDKEHHNDNMARIHEKATKKIIKMGKEVDPDTEDPLKAGLTRLYFATDNPRIMMNKGDLKTMDTIKSIPYGKIPNITRSTYVRPRCEMSEVKDEINVYGNKNIKQLYGRLNEDDGTYSNLWGEKKNYNYFDFTPSPRYETFDFWEFVEQVLDDIL